MKQTLPREEFLKLAVARMKEIEAYLGYSRKTVQRIVTSKGFPEGKNLPNSKWKYWNPREVVEHVENGV